MMNTPACPSFEQAIERFKGFMAAQGFPQDLRWVFAGDVTSKERKIWVRLPLKEDNPDCARRHYDLGLQRGLGIRLAVLCVIDNISYCYVWLPKDALDAEYALLAGGLKLSVPTNLPVACKARSGLVWRLRTWLNRPSHVRGVFSEIPDRSEAAPGSGG
jgi:hypothetical protein